MKVPKWITGFHKMTKNSTMALKYEQVEETSYCHQMYTVGTSAQFKLTSLKTFNFSVFMTGHRQILAELPYAGA